MTVTVKTSLVDAFNKKMKQLLKKNVYVGIPQSNSKREETEDNKSSQVTNAELAYINETGSPAQHIPPRPFLVPGVQDAKDKVVKILANAALTTDSNTDVDVALNKAGLVASQTVKRRITQSIDIEPLSPATIRARQTRKSRPRKGVMKPLIDSSQMLNSITYVIRDE